MNNLKKKVLFGLAIGLALAMAIGSFALEEDPALANAVGTAVSAPQAGTHNITTNIIGSGIVNAPQTASEGDTVSYTALADSGFRFFSTSVATTDGTPVTLTGSYTFTMPDADVIITVIFAGQHMVSVDPSVSNGTITPSEFMPYSGSTVTFTAQADSGYQLVQGSVTVKKTSDDSPVQVDGSGENYSFTMPNDNVAISAELELAPTPTPPQPGPEPTPTPTPEPTPDPSVNPDGDGGSGASSKTSDPFMGGAALALLGVATTGAVLVRKRK